jgi:hypothetical protein
VPRQAGLGLVPAVQRHVGLLARSSHDGMNVVTLLVVVLVVVLIVVLVRR